MNGFKMLDDSNRKALSQGDKNIYLLRRYHGHIVDYSYLLSQILFISIVNENDI